MKKLLMFDFYLHIRIMFLSWRLDEVEWMAFGERKKIWGFSQISVRFIVETPNYPNVNVGMREHVKTNKFPKLSDSFSSSVRAARRSNSSWTDSSKLKSNVSLSLRFLGEEKKSRKKSEGSKIFWFSWVWWGRRRRIDSIK